MKRPSQNTGCILLALALLPGCGVVSPQGIGSPQNGAVGRHDVILTWGASNDAKHYNVYRSQISGGYYGLIGSTPMLSFTDHNVGPGATYYYVCTAVDSTGRESGYSNEAQATTPSL